MNAHITADKFRADALRKAGEAAQQATKAAGFASLPDLKNDRDIQAIATACREFAEKVNKLIDEAAK